MRRWPSTGNGSTFVDVAASTHLFTLPEPETFDSLLSLSDINDDGQVVFVGVDSSSGTSIHKLRVRESMAGASAGVSIDIGDFPATAGLRPQISNTTEVVFRSVSGQSILKTDRMSDKFRRVAGSQEGFVAAGDIPAVGRSPGISDDGRIVVFFGNHPNDNVPGDGLGGGPGIFASILKPGGDPNGGSAERMLVRLAGSAGELGFDTDGNGLQLLDFSTYSSVSGTKTTDSRTGIGGPVLKYNLGTRTEHYVTFLAVDPRDKEDKKEALWQVRFDVELTPGHDVETLGKDIRNSVTSPQLVAKVGESIRGLTPVDLEIYDPITQQGHIAFWAALEGQGQAVFLATTSGDADRDGLLDFWEQSGIDVDENGEIDLSLAALGADPLTRDVFLELDWLAGRSPSGEALQSLRDVFASAPAPLGLAGQATGIPPGIRLHIDPTYSGQINGLDGRTDIIYMGLPGLTIRPDLDLSARSLQEVKDAAFGGDALLRKAREYVYHYAVLANFVSTIHVGAENGKVQLDDRGLSSRRTMVASPVQEARTAAHAQAASLVAPGSPFIATNSLRNHLVKIVAGAARAKSARSSRTRQTNCFWTGTGLISPMRQVATFCWLEIAAIPRYGEMISSSASASS